MLSLLLLILALFMVGIIVFLGEFGIWILLIITVYAIFKKLMEYFTNKEKRKQN